MNEDPAIIRLNFQHYMGPLTSEVSFNLPHRRLWLLSKGLESLPFSEALRVAKEAEDFVSGASPRELDPGEPMQEFGPREQASKFPPAAPASSSDDNSTASPQPETARDLAAEALLAETAADQQDDATESLVSNALVVLAEADDVVRYLRQRDDVVVPTGDRTYLVNARFRENLEQLVERANRMRARQKLCRFVLQREVQTGSRTASRQRASVAASC